LSENIFFINVMLLIVFLFLFSISIKGNPVSSEDGNDNIYNFSKMGTLNIPHQKKGPFVQNKMYCNLDLLKKAANTSEIR